jgi:hypothetical protein
MRNTHCGYRGRSQVLLVLAMIATGCNDIPIGSLHESFSIKVNQNQKNKDAVKVDFLWVIDNSSSMCQEQSSLATSFDDFINKINGFVNVDYRIAVVTTDLKSEDHKGKFRHHKATIFPKACMQTKITECFPGLAGDALCQNAYGGQWVCKGYDTAKKMVNCNGSVNSRCQKNCKSDSDCDTEFLGPAAGEQCDSDPGKCAYRCDPAPSDPAETGCVLRPETSACPESNTMKDQLVTATGTAPYLTQSNAKELFKCIATVGAEQGFDADLEQGLKASILALDKKGPNGEQAAAFMRDDAYLVIVYVSDEDDCSEGNGKSITVDEHDKCMCMTDSENGGKLLPVDQAVNIVKSFKADPGRVIVAGVIGDSVADDPEQVEVDRTAYFDSKCGICEGQPNAKHPFLKKTYVCASESGKADYGSRYVQFIKRFGQNGIITNICSDTGIAPALDAIAEQIILVFSKICLPRPILDTESLQVKKVGPKGLCTDGAECFISGGGCANGSKCVPNVTLLAPGSTKGSDTYQLVFASECTGTKDNQAIFLNFLLDSGAEVEVEYQAAPGLN